VSITGVAVFNLKLSPFVTHSVIHNKQWVTA